MCDYDREIRTIQKEKKMLSNIYFVQLSLKYDTFINK